MTSHALLSRPAGRARALLLALVFGAGLLAGCAGGAQRDSGGPAGAAPAPALPPGCNAAGAQSAVGKPWSAELEAAARQGAGARVSRVLRPGQPVTMEYNALRLNLEVDAAGRVVSARCG